MSSVVSRFAVDLIAVGLAGVAIKLMDDHLDYEADISQGQPSLVRALGGGAVLYSLVFALIGCAMNLRLACPLVLAAYVVGMLKNPGDMLPLGLSAWMESAVVALVTCLLFGWRLALVSVLLMTVVQLADDLRDFASDRAAGRANLARRLGKGEAFLLCLIALLGALVVDKRTTFLVCLCAPAIEVASRLVPGCRGGGADADVD
ncbi:MAG: hypothetical protein NUW12_02830 [Firmicutes bacterium]|jgi:1,4-dihydroxy-2-naphthoate octaprenyltransferase|nr:hypothetical protein [Bacillota bacterium]MDH7495102.1 hypothetical protein [Bacillota bacterium]